MIQGMAVTLLVDTLIKWGASKISDKDDAKLVEQTAKDAFGVVLDMNRPAAENAALLRPFITDELTKVSQEAMRKATEELDHLPPEVANSTMLSLYGGFSKGARAIMWLLVFGYLVVVAVFAQEFMSVFEEKTLVDVLTFVFYCLGGLVAVSIIPVRALSYFLISIGSAFASRKVKEGEQAKLKESKNKK